MMDDIPLTNGQLRTVLLIVGVVFAAVASPLLLMPADTGPSDAEMGEVTTSNPTATDSESPQQRMYAVPNSHIKQLSTRKDTETPPEPTEVRSSAGSQTMQVETTTVDGKPALVLRDDRTHSGRWVSIPTAWFEAHYGEIPKLTTVRHESGDTYQQATSVQNGTVRFHIKEFSTNTVTFSGQIDINSKKATNSTSHVYNVSAGALDDTSAPNVTFTGAISEDVDSKTGTVGSGEITTSIAGNRDPVNATLTLDAGETPEHLDESSTSLGGSHSFTVDFNAISDIVVTAKNAENDGTSDPMGPKVYVDGQLICDFPDETNSAYTQNTYTCEVDSRTSGNVQVVPEGDSINFPDIDTYGRPAANVNVTASGSTVDFGTFTENETKTKSIPATISTSSLNVSNEGGNATYDWVYTERTATTGGGEVTVNGNSLNFTGSLAEGEQLNKTGDGAWIVEGENSLEVTVGNGSLSADAPTPVVDIRYTHTLADDKTVSYESSATTESYNVSKTYASDRANAKLKIPFATNVVAINNIEYRVNESGGWSQIQSENFAIANTELTADVSGAYGGTIPAGTTVEVRTTGLSLNVINGSITVTSPDTDGGRLSVGFEVNSASDGFRVESGDKRLRYVEDESWDAAEYFVVDQSGQRLHLPNAAAGDTATLRTIPIEADVESGAARFEVPNASTTEPSWDVKPLGQSGQTVHYTFLEAQDGTKYDLWSVTSRVVRDSGTASSPLTLTDDDSEETLQFKLPEETTGGSTGGSTGGAVGVFDAPTDDTDWLPLIGVALALSGLVVASRNSDTVTQAGSNTAEGIEGALEGIPVLGPAVGRLIGGTIRSASQLARAGVENRTIALALGSAIAWGAVQFGIVELPAGSVTVILVAGVAVLSFVGLREYGEFDIGVWAGIVTATAATAAVVTSDADPVAAVVQSDILPLIAIGGLYVAYRGIKTLQAGQTTEIVLETDGGED